MKIMNRLIRILLLALACCGGVAVAVAQDLQHGQRLSERWCAACHAVQPGSANSKGVPTFAVIATKENITPEMIASFLRMPHATMTNVPLSRKDAEDIAAYIMAMKK